MTPFSSDRPSAGTVEVNGATLAYREQGCGPPLVLLHGGLGSSAEWEPILPVLASDFRVIAPDSRGHGRSTNPAGELSYPILADDVAALIAALNLDRPVVVGWSDGGQAVLELGVRHPGVADGLIVGGAHPDFTTTGLRDIHRELLGADADGRPDLEQLETELGDHAADIKSLHPGGEQRWRTLIDQTAGMWLDYPGLLPRDVEAIATPTLVLAGDRDELVALDLSLSLYRQLPNAELAVCPRADHGAATTPARADLFANLIRDFAQRHRPPDNTEPSRPPPRRT